MVVAAITIAATVTVRPSTANAQPVEYVRVCSIFGAEFFYLPGTDICLNVETNDARQETMGGVWRWRIPNNPRTWVPSPQGSCQGQLVWFGNINSAGLTQNSHGRFETNTRYHQLNLKRGQYISSVFYQGGFTGVGSLGNFCMYYYYNDPIYGPTYTNFGCIDTAPQATVPATLMFTPDNPIPPATSNPVYVLGAEGRASKAMSAADFQGTLSVWLCVQSIY